MTTFKRRDRRGSLPGASENAGEPVWSVMFRDYGLSVDLMPKTPPPARGSGYGAILEWVTGKSWEMPEHVSLAIDIWRGTVDPMSYAVGDRAEAPQATKPSQAALDSFFADPFGDPAPRPAAPQKEPVAPKKAEAQAPSGPGLSVPPARQRRRFIPSP